MALLEVKDLLIRGDVNALVKVIVLLAVNSRRNITGRIEGGAVTL